jgi:uncharacterized protein
MNKIVEPRFLVDFMLGKLAKWLRVIGYDTVYVKLENRLTTVLQSLKENRIILTRDTKLSTKRAWGLTLLKSENFHEQIKQLVKELKLTVPRERLFSRCTICNSKIEPVKDKNEIRDIVPKYVFDTQNDFSFCRQCNKAYWQGTHMGLLLKELSRLGIAVTNGTNLKK